MNLSHCSGEDICVFLSSRPFLGLPLNLFIKTLTNQHLRLRCDDEKAKSILEADVQLQFTSSACHCAKTFHEFMIPAFKGIAFHAKI